MNVRILSLMQLLAFSVSVSWGQSLINIHLSDGNVVKFPIQSIDSIVYSITNPKNIPIVNTTPANFITSYTAIAGGEVTSDGGAPILNVGICWGRQPNPTLLNSKVQLTTNSVSFEGQLGVLAPNSTYYARAFATNAIGTAYGNQIEFETTSLLDTIISIDGEGVTFDGYTYKTKILGNGQEWFAENLRTSIYANGDSLKNFTNYMDWYNDTTGAWSYVNEDSSLITPYGKLYNGYCVIDERNVCPTGWRVPNNEDWAYLTIYLGGDSKAGSALKDSNNFWGIQTINPSNSSQLSFFPSGYRNAANWTQLPVGANPPPEYFFEHVGQRSMHWSRDIFQNSSPNVPSSLFSFITIKSSNALIYSWDYYKNSGLAIRCIKN